MISSFLFNPLLLVCAFPPFVSMAMPSALHQEPRPACLLISLSPLSVFIRSYCPLNESHFLISHHVFLSLTLSLNLISQHSSFFLLLLFISSSLCACCLFFSSLLHFSYELISFIVFALSAFPNHSHFHVPFSGSSPVLLAYVHLYHTTLISFPGPSHLNYLAYFLLSLC